MRYIDADLLQAQIERGAEMTEKGIRLLDLSQQPTADVEPVVHAHGEPIKWFGLVTGWTCSCCGKEMAALAQYCPHCGARMDEQEEN